MDAMVFFAIAITISGILSYNATTEASQHPICSSDGQSDPETVLRVFLDSSIGQEVEMGLNGGVSVSSNSQIGECLKVEIDAIVQGTNVSVFGPLNTMYVLTLESICSPVVEPYLVALQLDEGRTRLLFSLPGEVPESATQYASSSDLPGSEDDRYLILLVLVPVSSASLAF